MINQLADRLSTVRSHAHDVEVGLCVEQFGKATSPADYR
jgi:hypothetical protein